MQELLKAVILRRLDPATRDWFERSWPPGDALNVNRFRAAFAGAGRRLGGLDLTAEDQAALCAAGIPAPERWRLDDVARAALLVRALETLPADAHVAFVRGIYLRGDYREQAAVLRALPLLPAPERFVETAINACRTNVLDVFEAIACENPYPARHFPDASFNQLVLKALFVGVPLGRIIGLAERNSRELQRMAQDYASERRAAGRPVPSDIDLVLAANRE